MPSASVMSKTVVLITSRFTRGVLKTHNVHRSWTGNDFPHICRHPSSFSFQSAALRVTRPRCCLHQSHFSVETLQGFTSAGFKCLVSWGSVCLLSAVCVCACVCVLSSTPHPLVCTSVYLPVEGASVLR